MTLDGLGSIVLLINGALIPVLLFGANSVSKRMSSILAFFWRKIFSSILIYSAVSVDRKSVV